jgi:hypothetical protein
MNEPDGNTRTASAEAARGGTMGLIDPSSSSLLPMASMPSSSSSPVRRGDMTGTMDKLNIVRQHCELKDCKASKLIFDLQIGDIHME